MKVAWDAGFPKVVGGKLKLSGTVTLANGWVSADNKVTITVAPTAGGVVDNRILTIGAGNTWTLEIDLTNYPAPAQDYDITPSVNANQGGGASYIVTGARQTIMLP